jgi:hypothetical protein
LPARELIEAEEEFRADVPIELRVEFSAVRLSRQDAAEQAFDAMLRGSEPDLRQLNDPIAIPVFGRGRTYYALAGQGIQPDTIEENGHFLCGACSCQIKNENPGVDLLIAMNWDAHIGGSAMPEVVLPELTGIGALELAAAPESNPVAGQLVAEETPASAAPPEAAPGTATTGEVTAVTNPADSLPAATVAPGAADNAPSGSATHLTAGAQRPAADQPPASASPANQPGPTAQEQFQTRLTYGVAAGVAVAVLAVVLLTFGLRRS